MAHFNIGSLKVWGFRDKNKKHELFIWLNAKDLSIVSLQETHCTSELQDLWKTEWGHEIYFSNRRNHSGGLFILFSQKPNYSIEETITDTNGRYILVKVKVLGAREEYIFCNIYTLNKDDPLFFIRYLSN